MSKQLTTLATTILFVILGGFVSSYGQQHILIVVGAAGEPEFGGKFQSWAQNWVQVADEGSSLTTIGVDSNSSTSGEDDRRRLQSQLAKFAQLPKEAEVWIVLIGHGTFDGGTAKFNLKGRDVSANELKDWIEPIQSRLVLINCSSCSSPFINRLSAPNRIIVSATNSGSQYNFARIGEYLSTAISDEAIDLDKDGQTSLLESFIAASARTQEFYDAEKRLATEQALLDDNGDGFGTPANWFAGTRSVKKAKSGLADGLSANQVFFVERPGGVSLTGDAKAKRDQLEIQLEELRQQKSQLSDDAYYRELEVLMLQLAKLYTESED